MQSTLVDVADDVVVDSVEGAAAFVVISLVVILSKPSADVVLGSKSAHSFPKKPCGQRQASSPVVAWR